MSLLESRVGELVSQDFRNAHVFSRFGIDFCCGGGRTLASACERAKANPAEVVAELNTLQQGGDADTTFAELSTPELIE
ncbi:MAG: DUF542 domain-containing protein, partial [Plesiomonas sp.]